MGEPTAESRDIVFSPAQRRASASAMQLAALLETWSGKGCTRRRLKHRRRSVLSSIECEKWGAPLAARSGEEGARGARQRADVRVNDPGEGQRMAKLSSARRCGSG